jgi:hypothetical protein
MNNLGADINTFTQVASMLQHPGPYSMASSATGTEFLDSFQSFDAIEAAVLWARAEQANKRAVFFIPHVCRHPGTGRNGIVTMNDVTRFLCWAVYLPRSTDIGDQETFDHDQKEAWQLDWYFTENNVPLSLAMECGSGIVVMGVFHPDVTLTAAEYPGLCNAIVNRTAGHSLYIPVPFGKSYGHAWHFPATGVFYPEAGGIIKKTNFELGAAELKPLLEIAAGHARQLADSHQLAVAKARNIPPLLQVLTKLLHAGQLPFGAFDKKKRVKIQRSILHGWIVEQCGHYPAGFKLPSPADITAALELHAGVHCRNVSGEQRSYLFASLSACRATAESTGLVDAGAWERPEKTEWTIVESGSSPHINTAEATLNQETEITP